ncbi:MAG: twin-arginine translocase subunit TatC, partial [Acidimicrobiia bacterium]
MTGRQGILGHLSELRSRLVRSAAALVVASIVAFVFRNWIFDVLAQPWNDLAADRGYGNLVFFRPTEAFSLMMRLSLFGGVIIASPVIIWQVWAFVVPGLTRREQIHSRHAESCS